MEGIILENCNKVWYSHRFITDNYKYIPKKKFLGVFNVSAYIKGCYYSQSIDDFLYCHSDKYQIIDSEIYRKSFICFDFGEYREVKNFEGNSDLDLFVKNNIDLNKLLIID